MDDFSTHGEGVELSDHTVVAEGHYGAVSWTVSKELYALLPRSMRDQLLDGSATRKITPYFNGLAERLLKQAGHDDAQTHDLSTEWSFETRLVTCAFGAVNWQVGQGIWDAIPEDQRTSLYEFSDRLVHDFFGQEVYAPLMQYALNKLHG